MEMSFRQQGLFKKKKKLDLFTDEKKVEMERLVSKGVFNLKAYVICRNFERKRDRTQSWGTGQVNGYPGQKEYPYLWYWKMNGHKRTLKLSYLDSGFI